ncbi:MAG TPA: hypothetical protein VHB21_26395 [Minicystis sp.]|nr:hypothetical protein [Minicystis sp.]
MSNLVPTTPQALAFNAPTYLVRRPFWSFLGRKYYVYGPGGALVAFVKHPLMKLREEFTMFADEGETTPLIRFTSRQILALNRCIDVVDVATGRKVGTIRSRGLKSIVRDTWDILDENDQPVGLMEEEGAALLRRFFKFLPGRHKIEIGGQRVAELRQPFRFFVKELELDVSMGQGRIDTKFALACAVLALMADARREETN